MSLKASVVISFEELRALSHIFRLGLEQIDRIQSDPHQAVAKVHGRVGSQFIAGCRSALWQELSALKPGDHLRELYWANAWEINDDDLQQESGSSDSPDFDNDEELLELINVQRARRGQEPLALQDI